jgi:outer membrane protein TolC
LGLEAFILLAAVVSVGLGTAAGDPDGAPPAGLTLADTMGATLQSNPDIRVAFYQAESSRGALVSAGAPFDFTMSTTGAGQRTHTLDPSTGAPAIQDQISYSYDAERLLRNGIALSPQIALTRSSYSTQAGIVVNSAQVGLTVTVPMLQDRGGAVTAATERAASTDYSSSLQSLAQTTAERILAAAVSYWDYVSAERRLEALRASENRAEQTVAKTRTLVSADERTPADLTQILGNLGSRRVSRINAEQAVSQAREQLGLAMGLEPEQIPLLPEPATDFPPPLSEESPQTPLPRLLEMAYTSRADLSAAELDVTSARTRMDAARNGLLHRLDLAVGAGYVTTLAGRSFQDFLGFGGHSIYKGPDASAQLIYEFPGGSSRSRALGRLLQSTAVHEQQRVLRDDLRRQIAAGVWISTEALHRSGAAVRESEEAVRLTESTVQASVRKFEVSDATLFDVIQAEDQLTSAVLARIQSRRDYAVAVVTLRFASGALLQSREGKPTVDAALLLTPP